MDLKATGGKAEANGDDWQGMSAGGEGGGGEKNHMEADCLISHEAGFRCRLLRVLRVSQNRCCSNYPKIDQLQESFGSAVRQHLLRRVESYATSPRSGGY